MTAQTLCACVFLAASTVLWTGCGGESADVPRNAAPVNVETSRPRLLDGGASIAYSGTIEASESIPMSFAVMGSVARVLVAEGDPVREGQLLAVLDTTTMRNALDMSLATERQAQDAYNRLLPMYRNGNLPEVKFIEVESDLSRARSATIIARKNLKDCMLRAPASGIVGARSIEPGMNTVPNLVSISIVRIGRVFARISVSENEISSIRKGQQAEVRLAALGDATVTGAVEEIGVVADPLAHAYPVRIGIRNGDGAIKPGMICQVRIDHAAAREAVVLPNAAVLVDETGKNYIYVVIDGRAVRRFVTPAGFADDGIAIRDGVRLTDEVIVTGQHKLADQSPIHVVKSGGAGTGMP